MRLNVLGGLLAAVVAGTACHSLTPLSWSELEGIRPSRVWVTRADQSVVEVTGPQVFGDTLVGYIDGEFYELPTSDLRRAVIRQPARAKTIGLAVAGVAVTAALVAMVAGNENYVNPAQFTDCDDNPEEAVCQGYTP
jgi:hypothetical protein